jgi:hypothetical protein
MVQKIRAGIAEGLQAEIIVGLLNNDNLLVFGQGAVEAYLARNGKLARLGNDFSLGLSIEGVLKSDDVVVLSTTKFREVVTLNKFKEIIITDGDPAEMWPHCTHTK